MRGGLKCIYQNPDARPNDRNEEHPNERPIINRRLLLRPVMHKHPPRQLPVQGQVAGPYTPIFIAGEGAAAGDDKFLLGGKHGFIRKREKYSVQLREVQGYNRVINMDRGRQLCLVSLRQEFSIETLSTHNATGKTFVDRKKANYPKFNPIIMDAIFA